MIGKQRSTRLSGRLPSCTKCSRKSSVVQGFTLN